MLVRSLGAIAVDYSGKDVNVLTALKDLTGGIGLDACIDAVGLEAHSTELRGVYDKVKNQSPSRDGPARRASPGDTGRPQGRNAFHSG
jgi:threonine dehydrogenase-like Zn-dependent dehydrogenase